MGRVDRHLDTSKDMQGTAEEGFRKVCVQKEEANLFWGWQDLLRLEPRFAGPNMQPWLLPIAELVSCFLNNLELRTDYLSNNWMAWKTCYYHDHAPPMIFRNLENRQFESLSLTRASNFKQNVRISGTVQQTQGDLSCVARCPWITHASQECQSWGAAPSLPNDSIPLQNNSYTYMNTN